MQTRLFSNINCYVLLSMISARDKLPNSPRVTAWPASYRWRRTLQRHAVAQTISTSAELRTTTTICITRDTTNPQVRNIIKGPIDYTSTILS